MRTRLTVLTAGIALVIAPQARAEEKPALSRQIDQLIQKSLDEAKVPASPLADDAEFLRRVYLDITGRISTYEQTTTFLASKDPARRAKLIDELLARPEYGLHFATIWRDLIVDRSAEMSRVRQQFSWEFITWLAEGFNKGRGWNELVSDMLTAEGEAKKNPATTFVMSNLMNDFPRPEDMVGSTSKLFMGIHLRCAQCHDHPFVDEWKQNDFWGVAAFFGQVRDHGSNPNGGSQNPDFREFPHPDEKKEAQYANRIKRAGMIPPQSGPQIAIPTIADPTMTQRLVKAKFFLAEAPTLGEKGPYRPQFAAWLTAPENPYFARAAVNRIWTQFFAHGIVDPVDDMGPNHPASHPELLALLAKDFKANGFNTKQMIRAICNSQTYQRTSRPLPQNKEDTKFFSHMLMKQLTPDQTVDSLCVAVARAVPVGKNRDQLTAPFATKEANDRATEFSHGIPQFLLQMNAGIGNGNTSVSNRFTTGKSKEEAVTAMYMGILSRPPQPKELERMVAYVNKAANPQDGYRDVFWVLLNSAEFILNR